MFCVIVFLYKFICIISNNYFFATPYIGTVDGESDNGIQAFKDEFGHDWVVSEKINPKNDKEAKPQAIFLQ